MGSGKCQSSSRREGSSDPWNWTLLTHTINTITVNTWQTQLFWALLPTYLICLHVCTCLSGKRSGESGSGMPDGKTGNDYWRQKAEEKISRMKEKRSINRWQIHRWMVGWIDGQIVRWTCTNIFISKLQLGWVTPMNGQQERRSKDTLIRHLLGSGLWTSHFPCIISRKPPVMALLSFLFYTWRNC